MTTNSPQPKKTSRLIKGLREIVSILFWAFALIKLFVLDIDVLLITKVSPSYSWLLDYKFFIFFGTIAVVWLVVGNRTFRNSIVYVLFYPIVILFYHLPKLIFRNWTLAFIFLPSLVATVKSFKLRFISTIFAVISCLLIILQIDVFITVASMLVLFGYLAIHYAQQFRTAFSTSGFFADVSKAIQALWTYLKDTAVSKELQTAATMKEDSDEYKLKRASILQNLFVYNRFFLFGASKLKRLQDSRIMDLYLIGTLLYTFAVTVLVFAFEYYSLYRLNPASFVAIPDPSFFYFLYASFNTLLTIGFGDFSPLGVVARLLTSLELFTWILIFLILYFTVTSILRERYQKEADTVVEQLSSEGQAIEDLIIREYKLSLEEAEASVTKASPNIVKIIEYLRTHE
jgi:hypothetical protein